MLISQIRRVRIEESPWRTEESPGRLWILDIPDSLLLPPLFPGTRSALPPRLALSLSKGRGRSASRTLQEEGGGKNPDS